MIDFYYFTSPNSRKVLIALEECGLPYEIRWTDITRGDQFRPEFVAVNPNSKVPAIVDRHGPGGRPLRLFESAAILLYLADKTGRLLPTDPAARWEAICWTVWQVANQGPGAGQAGHFLNYAPDVDEPGHAAAYDYPRRRYGAEVARCYRMLEDRLTGRDYLVDDQLTIADIACFPWTRVAKGHGIDLADYPAVQGWSDRIATRPSATVKVEDRRSEDVKNFRYTEEQRAVLFRTEPEA